MHKVAFSNWCRIEIKYKYSVYTSKCWCMLLKSSQVLLCLCVILSYLISFIAGTNTNNTAYNKLKSNSKLNHALNSDGTLQSKQMGGVTGVSHIDSRVWSREVSVFISAFLCVWFGRKLAPVLQNSPRIRPILPSLGNCPHPLGKCVLPSSRCPRQLISYWVLGVANFLFIRPRVCSRRAQGCLSWPQAWPSCNFFRHFMIKAFNPIGMMRVLHPMPKKAIMSMSTHTENKEHRYTVYFKTPWQILQFYITTSHLQRRHFSWTCFAENIQKNIKYYIRVRRK